MQRKGMLWQCMAAVPGILWLGVFPLWQDMSYAHITRAKWVGLLALCGATAVLCAVMALLCRRQWRKTLRWHPAQGVAVAYFGWVALSAWLGRWADTLNGSGQLTVLMGAIRYEGLLTHLCYGAVFLLMSFFPPKMDAVLNAAATAMIVFCGIAAVQYSGANVLGLFPAGRSIYTNYEFQSTIGNIDMVSGYLSLVTPLLLGGFMTRGKGGWLLLAAATLGVALELCMEVQSGLIALLLLFAITGVLMLRYPRMRARGFAVLGSMMLAYALRSMLFLPWLDSDTPRAVQPVRLIPGSNALLGLAGVALMAGCALLAKKYAGKPVKWKAIAALAVCGVLVVCCGVILLDVPESMGGLYELHEVLNGRPQDHFGSWRLGAWRCSLEMSRESLLFGNGPDTFYAALADHLEKTGTSLGEKYDNPHNEYVAILVNNGLPALLAYLTLLGTVLAACIRRGHWALAMAIGCYGAQGFFSFSICLVTPMFWAVLGMAAALCGRPLQREAESDIIIPEVN